MAINCSSNALLDTLNQKKDELNNKIAELQSLGAAAMADIQAKADAMKDALLAAVPVPPAIPNFKKELEELRNKVGKELAEAKAAFKERWGDALPDIDIDGLMDKVSAAKSLIDNFEEDLTDFATGLAGKVTDKFDFCKDVPNIDAPKVSPEGKVEQVKVKAEEPVVAADIPKKVEPVVPTVIEKEKQPSVSPKLEVDDTADKMKKERDEMNRSLNGYREKYNQLMRDATSEAIRAKLQGGKTDDVFISIDSKFVNSIVGRAETSACAEGISLLDYYNSGKQSKKFAQIIIKKFLIAQYQVKKYKEYNGQMMIISRGMIHGFGSLTLEEQVAQRIEYMNKSIVEVQENGDVLSLVPLGGHDSVLKGYRDIIVSYQETLAKLKSYKA